MKIKPLLKFKKNKVYKKFFLNIILLLLILNFPTIVHANSDIVLYKEIKISNFQQNIEKVPEFVLDQTNSVIENIQGINHLIIKNVEKIGNKYLSAINHAGGMLYSSVSQFQGNFKYKKDSNSVAVIKNKTKNNDINSNKKTKEIKTLKISPLKESIASSEPIIIYKNQEYDYSLLTKDELEARLKIFESQLDLKKGVSKVVYRDQLSKQSESLIDGNNDSLEEAISGGSSNFNGNSLIVSKNINANGFNVTDGIVTAQRFIGDGSGLTGISSSGGFATSSVLSLFSTDIVGFEYSTSTGVFSLNTLYNIPTNASTTEWDNKISSQWVNNGSDIYYNSGNLVLGTTTSVATLTVVGDFNLKQEGTNAIVIGSTSGGTRGQNSIDFQSGRDNLDEIVSGQKSGAFGYGNKISNNNTYAVGNYNTSLDQGDNYEGNLLLGNNNDTNGGNTSFAIGSYNVSSDNQTYSIGYSNTSSYNGSFSLGLYNESTANQSLSIGHYNNSSGNQSLAIGSSNEATNNWANAFGHYNRVSGNTSSAFGNDNEVTGDSSSVFGQGNDGFGYSSVALGNGNSAAGDYSVSVGRNNSSEGYGSITFGESNTLGATDYQSSAFGRSNNISGEYNFISGNYNSISNINEAYIYGSYNTSSASNTYILGKYITNDVANSVMIGPNNSSKITILQNGMVGIGTTTPSAKLSIQGDLDITGGIKVSGNFGTIGQILQTTGSGVQWVATSSLGISAGTPSQWVTSGSDIYYSTGNIGIGTTTPSAKLDILGSLKVGGGSLSIPSNIALYVRDTGSSASTWKGRIVAGGDNVAFLMGEYNSQAWLGGHNAALNAWAPLRINPDGTSDLYLGNLNSGGAGLSPIITLQNSNGRVGIGTTTPASRLDIYGIAGSTDILSISSSTNSRIFTVASNGNVGIGVAAPSSNLQINSSSVTRLAITSGSTFMSFGADTTSGPYFMFNNTQDLRFATANSSTGSGFSEKMRLTSTGNLGVGTTSPQYRLHVVGDDGSGNVAKFQTTSGATSCTLNSSTGLLNCSSDQRLKKDITEITSSLDKLNQLKPVSYLWKTDEENASLKYGFIAQEIEKVFPEIVSTDSDTGFKSVGMTGLIPFIIDGMQEIANRLAVVSDWFSEDGNKFNVNGEVCVDDVCISKEEFKDLLIKNGANTGSPINNQTNNINTGDSSVEDNIIDENSNSEQNSSIETIISEDLENSTDDTSQTDEVSETSVSTGSNDSDTTSTNDAVIN